MRYARILLPLAALALAAARVAREADAFALLANRHRAEVGCAALRWDARLAAVAEAHADDMRARAYFDHTSPEGRSFAQRLRDAGLVERGPAGENLALGQPDAAHALADWLRSPPHRENLDDCGFTHHGLGVSGPYWVHVLARLPAAPAAAAH